ASWGSPPPGADGPSSPALHALPAPDRARRRALQSLQSSLSPGMSAALQPLLHLRQLGGTRTDPARVGLARRAGRAGLTGSGIAAGRARRARARRLGSREPARTPAGALSDLSPRRSPATQARPPARSSSASGRASSASRPGAW